MKKSLNLFYSGYMSTGNLANSKDPDEILLNVAFHLGLHCLQNNKKTIDGNAL